MTAQRAEMMEEELEAEREKAKSRMTAQRAEMTEEELEAEREKTKSRKASQRAEMTEEELEAEREKTKSRKASQRAEMTEEETAQRRAADRKRKAEERANETAAERAARLKKAREAYKMKKDTPEWDAWYTEHLAEMREYYAGLSEERKEQYKRAQTLRSKRKRDELETLLDLALVEEAEKAKNDLLEREVESDALRKDIRKNVLSGLPLDVATGVAQKQNDKREERKRRRLVMQLEKKAKAITELSGCEGIKYEKELADLFEDLRKSRGLEACVCCETYKARSSCVQFRGLSETKLERIERDQAAMMDELKRKEAESISAAKRKAARRKMAQFASFSAACEAVKDNYRGLKEEAKVDPRRLGHPKQPEGWICRLCWDSLRNGYGPRLGAHNSLKPTSLQSFPNLANLGAVGQKILAQRVLFCKIFRLPTGGQYAMKGGFTNVPCRVQESLDELSSTRRLPLTFQEAQFVGVETGGGTAVKRNMLSVELRRQMRIPRSHAANLVDIDVLIAAAEELKTYNRYWKDIEIRTRQEWETQARDEDAAMFNALTRPTPTDDQDDGAEAAEVEGQVEANPFPDVLIANAPNIDLADPHEKMQSEPTAASGPGSPAGSPTKSPAKKTRKKERGVILAPAEDERPIALFMDPDVEQLV